MITTVQDLINHLRENMAPKTLIDFPLEQVTVIDHKGFRFRRVRVEDVHRLQKQGLSVPEIAEKLNASRGVVNYALKRDRLDRRRELEDPVSL